MITPDISEVHVLEFCRGISTAPVCLIPVVPESGFEFGNCFNNVDTVVMERGGVAVYGWHLTEWPGVFIEAEQHSVWRRPDGFLLDPSPHRNGFSEIAFLPQPPLGIWTFQERRNKPLNNSHLVLDFLAAAADEGRERLKNGVASRQTIRRVQQQLARLVARYGSEPCGDARSPAALSKTTKP